MFKKKFGRTNVESKTVAERVAAIQQVAAEMDRILHSPERFRVAQAEIRAAIVRKQSEDEYWSMLTEIHTELKQREWEIPEPKAKLR